MKLVFDESEWLNAVMDTALTSVMVKEIPGPQAKYRLCKERRLTGVMHKPVVIVGMARDDSQLYKRTDGFEEVVVIGHGQPDCVETKFIWKGTPAEFREYWRGD